MVNCKKYTDKGVQTNLAEEIFHHDPNDSCLDEVSNIDDYWPSEHDVSSELSLALQYMDHIGAYIYPDNQEKPSQYNRQLSVQPSPKTSRTPKYGQLSQKWPSGIAHPSNRLVSLPETSPPYRIGNLQERAVRLVSMPESLKDIERAMHQSRDPSDKLDNSFASEKSHHRGSETEHTTLGGSLQTPSPPSSPESVMIIGNDTQVQRGFLRPKYSCDEDENGGWIPWKSSPPKPIPALHGPLSLPYARCPSGAEGTVIEGEDMTHMIWGLDSNSATIHGKHPSHSLGYKHVPRRASSNQLQKAAALNYVPDFTAYDLRDHDVIDISRPELFQAAANATLIPQGRGSKIKNSRTPNDLPLLGKEDKTKQLYAFDFSGNSAIQLYPSSLANLHSDDYVLNSGLGIDIWKGNEDRILSFTPFFPSPAESYLPIFDRTQPPLETDNFRFPETLGETLYNPRKDNQQHCTYLPTPPSTTSSQWSPYFNQVYLTPETQYEITPQNSHSIYNVPAIQEQQSCSTFDVVGRGNDLREQVVQHLVPRPSLDCGTHQLTAPRPRVSQDTSSSNEHHICANPTLKNQISKSDSSLTLPPFPDIRRNLNFRSQQPRSIPLARLIQRRLASVPEEEVEVDGGETPIIPPMLVAQPKMLINEEEALGHKNLENGPNTVTSSITTPPIPQSSLKRVYRHPGHPSRRSPGSSQGKVGSKVEKSQTDMTKNEESQGSVGVEVKKPNVKANKPYKKKRAPKK